MSVYSGAGPTSDLYADETVDLKGLAEIADAWLDELLLPARINVCKS
jgi:hypothetical protein